MLWAAAHTTARPWEGQITALWEGTEMLQDAHRAQREQQEPRGAELLQQPRGLSNHVNILSLLSISRTALVMILSRNKQSSLSEC